MVYMILGAVEFERPLRDQEMSFSKFDEDGRGEQEERPEEVPEEGPAHDLTLGTSAKAMAYKDPRNVL